MIRNATNRLVLNSGRRIIKNRLISSCTAVQQQHKEAVAAFSMRDAFRYSPDEGYIRTSAFNDVSMQNMTIDQYIWQDLGKFQDKCAIVSISIFGFLIESVLPLCPTV